MKGACSQFMYMYQRGGLGTDLSAQECPCTFAVTWLESFDTKKWMKIMYNGATSFHSS